MAHSQHDREIEQLNNLLTLDVDHVEVLSWDYHETICYPRNILSCCIRTGRADNYYEDVTYGERLYLTPGWFCLIPQNTCTRFGRTLDTTSITIHFSLEFSHGPDLYSGMKRGIRFYAPETVAALETCLRDPDKLRGACGIRGEVMRICFAHWPTPLPCSPEALAAYGPLFEYIRNRCTASLNVAELAAQMGRRQDVFTRSFRKAFGITPHDYIRKALVRRICARLSGDDRTIREIASDLEFSSEFYLSRFFKQNTGLSPRDYRARFGGNASRLHKFTLPPYHG
ncbi:MAG: AraC family transcriptional regulator [Candidatus Omnitrophota bacterium]